MAESEQSENIPRYSKEQVIVSFRKFIDRGITNPLKLPLDDPEVVEANRILYAWAHQEEKETSEKGTIEAKLQFDLDMTTIMVDAGFSDPDYLDEIVSYLVSESTTDAEREGSLEMLAKIDAKIAEIEATYKKVTEPNSDI